MELPSTGPFPSLVGLSPSDLVSISSVMYRLICLPYAYLAFYLQNIFLKGSLVFGPVSAPICVFPVSLPPLSDMLNSSEVLPFPYSERLLLPEHQIYGLLETVFTSSLRSSISGSHGFSYCINFFTLYRNYPVPRHLQDKSIYANIYHYDKPYSLNLLKVIVPLGVVSSFDGPLQVLVDSRGSKSEEFSMTSVDCPVAYTFYPRQSLHRDSIPIAQPRLQIMFQLIPARRWCFARDLAAKQSLREPKFPELNLFRGVDLF